MTPGGPDPPLGKRRKKGGDRIPCHHSGDWERTGRVVSGRRSKGDHLTIPHGPDKGMETSPLPEHGPAREKGKKSGFPPVWSVREKTNSLSSFHQRKGEKREEVSFIQARQAGIPFHQAAD